MTVPVAAPQQLPTDVATLQNMLKSATAQLMAHSQTVNELLKANMDLRAALHMSQMHETSVDQHKDNGAVLDAAPISA